MEKKKPAAKKSSAKKAAKKVAKKAPAKKTVKKAAPKKKIVSEKLLKFITLKSTCSLPVVLQFKTPLNGVFYCS